MLKIYDKKEDVPESDKEFFEKHYKQRADGKWEPQIEGVNSIGGVLTKNAELVEKINKEYLPKLREYEGKEVLTDGKVAVDKKDFDLLESYKTLGSVDDIKPKVEGFEALRTEARQALRDRALMAAGVTDIARAKGFKAYDALEIESEVKDGKEIFYSVSTDDKGKTSKIPFGAESLKADGFKDNLGSLLGEGKKMFRQVGTGTGANRFDAAREKVKEQTKQTGAVSFEDKFYKRSATQPAPNS